MECEPIGSGDEGGHKARRMRRHSQEFLNPVREWRQDGERPQKKNRLDAGGRVLSPGRRSA